MTTSFQRKLPAIDTINLFCKTSSSRQRRPSTHDKSTFVKIKSPIVMIELDDQLAMLPSLAYSPLQKHTNGDYQDLSSGKRQNSVKLREPLEELFISPHPDDICYSCFRTVARSSNSKDENESEERASRVIVTVFSQSRCANGEIGVKLKHNVKDTTRLRFIEDEQFATSVGCQLKSLNLPDSSARDEISRWPHLAEEDLETQHQIVKAHPTYLSAEKALDDIVRWAVKCKAAIYLPLAIGCHIDHLMTRVAVTCILEEIKAENQWTNLPSKLTYYEDLPYAYYVTEDSIERFAMNILPKTAQSNLIPIDEACWQKKKIAVMGYASQMKPQILPDLHSRAQNLAGKQGDLMKADSTSSLRERVWLI